MLTKIALILDMKFRPTLSKIEISSTINVMIRWGGNHLDHLNVIKQFEI